MSDSVYQRNNYFDYHEGDEDKHHFKYRLDHSMPVESLLQTLTKQDDNHIIDDRTQAKIDKYKKYSYKNMWILNKN